MMACKKIFRLMFATAPASLTSPQFPAALLLHLNHHPVRPFVSKFASHIDRTRIPKLCESDLDEQFTRGSGPGGQATNKTNNAVVLRHVPTNIVIKCHAGRALSQNRKEARRLMTIRLDNLYNGEQSVEAQEARLGQQKLAETQRRRRKMDEMKRAWREREKGDGAEDR